MRADRAAPRRAVFAGLAVLALAGCVTAPRQPAPIVPWPQRRARLQSLDPFELSGRVAVAAAGEGFDAHLDWRQLGARTTLDLNGPLGIGGVHVVSDGPTLDVETSSGQKLTSAEARAQLTAKLGFEPPLGSLRYWILGVPDPAGPSTETIGDDQRLAAMQQYGWRIDYLAYTNASGYWLPQRLALTRGNVRVRLVVDRWQP
jgi:outer membrane lipoprotein LolB